MFRLTDVRMIPGADRDMGRGLLGYVSCTYGRVRLDVISLRRTWAGRLALSFPVRGDADGHNRPIIRHLDDRTRREIESQVLTALDLPEVAP